MITPQTYGLVAIVTKYHGYTNTRPARISATAGAKPHQNRIMMSYPDEAQDAFAAHRMVADALMKKMGWETRQLVSGHIPGGMAHVMVPK